jgi:hypothetical protein
MNSCCQAKRASNIAAVLCLSLVPAVATLINVSPGDSYTKIESANPGDEVVIAPGTYAFRVYLTKQASPTNPITIRAQDPLNRPIWDFGTNLVENAPGSYTAGDRGRGGWQFSGAHNYNVSGIIFRNCRTGSKNSAGIRYYNGTTNLYLKDCLFTLNDDGLTGGTQESQATVEFCEFNANGNTGASLSSPTHNIYVYGGYLTLRYCYVHDCVQGQNFHIRCHDATLEYNWFARANNYEGDLMTDDDLSGTGPFTQTLTLRGNVFVQNTSPSNTGQEIAIYNDTSLPNLTLSLRALYNTFVGNGGSTAFVHVSNADGTSMKAEISNNIISGTTRPTLIENASQASVTGVNNWLRTNATAGPLAGSVQTATPGFRNPASQNYTLLPSSPCIGAASFTLYGLPGREYYLNEATSRMWRVRAAARDIGAFENSSTNGSIGPYDLPPRPVLNIARSGSTAQVSWPLFAQDFLLQQADLAGSSGWTFSSAAYLTNASAVLVMAPATAGQKWFRLQR